MGVISKHSVNRRRPDQDMVSALTQLRESGQIPWSAIVDETRSLDDRTGFASVCEGLDEYLNAVRLDPWDGAPPLILTESRSLAGVLRNLVSEYRVMIGPTNGQAAGFLHNGVAPRLTDGMRVLYLGDHDLAGGDIEGNTRSVLERYATLKWERLALTQEQEDFYGLTPITKTDGRFKDGGEHEATETEALSQATIVQIVKDRLEELSPEPLEDVQKRENEQRERLRKYLSSYSESDP
jgi:hypothetical protein